MIYLFYLVMIMVGDRVNCNNYGVDKMSFVNIYFVCKVMMSKIILTCDSKYEAIIWYCNGGLSGRMLSENMLLQKDSLVEYEQLMNTCDHVFSTAEPSGQSAPFNIFQAQKMALPVTRLNNPLMVIRMV